MEDQYRGRIKDIVVSWIEQNLYKMITVTVAVGSYLGMNEAAESGDLNILIISLILLLAGLIGVILWIVELIRTPFT